MPFPVSDMSYFVAYTVTMCVTPGPNNAMLAALGARHGLRGAVPYAMGVMVGVFGLLVMAGAGVGSAIASVPVLKGLLTVSGVVYLGWLARSLWRAKPKGASTGTERIGFFSALAFQAANPKALMMAITAMGTFLAPSAGAGGAVAVALLYVAIGLPCIGLWALMGDRLRTFLSSPSRELAFSRVNALMVAFTAVGIAVEAL